MFVLWFGERITDKGLGNGVSLIIMIGIIARLPGALLSEWGTVPLLVAASGGEVSRDRPSSQHGSRADLPSRQPPPPRGAAASAPGEGGARQYIP